MKKFTRFLYCLCAGAIIGIVVEKATKKKQQLAKNKGKHVPFGPYEAFFKRPLDILLAGIGLILFSPIMGITALLVKIKLGSPVIFMQQRPGRDEKIFEMYKFRTMTDKKDTNGELLPDEERLTKFGRKLRESSLDELPELFNILKGEMSFVGPRPQLVQDMLFMTSKQRQRHNVMPGLSGLAQINGRNVITWEEKLEWDLKYIENITLKNDIKIIFLTLIKALIKHEGISQKGNVTAMNYGDYLLKSNKINHHTYQLKLKEARQLLER